MRQTEMIEWVPVAEGLPEKRCRWYLVTNKFGGVSEEWFGDMGEFEASPGSYLSKDYAIAWATLPEPYREVQHEAD